MKLDSPRTTLLESRAPWAVVQAFAGAGKTRLAIEVASRFRMTPGLRPGQRILFVSFSTASCLRANESLRGSAVPPDDVEVCTFHSFGLSLVRRYAVRLGLQGPIRTGGRAAPIGSYLTYDEVITNARKALADRDVADIVADAYPLVIVDEFQDTSPPLLDILVAGFVGKSIVRCFGDSYQRIQPGALTFNAHAASITEGAEEHQIGPIPNFCRFQTHDIADLAEAFKDCRRFGGSSNLISFRPVPSDGEQLAHSIHWDALASMKGGRSTAVVCFSNSAVSKVADLLGTVTDKRRVALPVRTVASKDVMAAQDDLYVALLRHWRTPSAETSKGIVDALALLAVGGSRGHRHYDSRSKRLIKEMKKGGLPDLPERQNASPQSARVADTIESLGDVAGSLGDAVTAIWPSARWSLQGLRGLAWHLSQVVPDGIRLTDPDSLDRLTSAWDQARRWRTTPSTPILVMTVNQSKNREFDDVIVYVDGFQNEIRGPITETNKMQMYVATSRGRRSVKVVWLENRQTKRRSDLLAAVVPGQSSPADVTESVTAVREPTLSAAPGDSTR